jgi:hypothetical protein
MSADAGLTERLARHLCARLWGDPDLMVRTDGAAPSQQGPMGTTVIGGYSCRAWQVYLPVVTETLAAIINEFPELAVVIDPDCEVEKPVSVQTGDATYIDKDTPAEGLITANDVNLVKWDVPDWRDARGLGPSAEDWRMRLGLRDMRLHPKAT